MRATRFEAHLSAIPQGFPKIAQAFNFKPGFGGRMNRKSRRDDRNAPKPCQNVKYASRFGAWCLELLWSLELGVWSFSVGTLEYMQTID
jgi:hypothetical protein